VGAVVLEGHTLYLGVQWRPGPSLAFSARPRLGCGSRELPVMVRSLGLHRIEARSFWGLAARVNLILLVHNLIRSRVLLRMAGVEL
jgi:hypothetical protein